MAISDLLYHPIPRELWPCPSWFLLCIAAMIIPKCESDSLTSLLVSLQWHLSLLRVKGKDCGRLKMVTLPFNRWSLFLLILSWSSNCYNRENMGKSRCTSLGPSSQEGQLPLPPLEYSVMESVHLDPSPLAEEAKATWRGHM